MLEEISTIDLSTGVTNADGSCAIAFATAASEACLIASTQRNASSWSSIVDRHDRFCAVVDRRSRRRRVREDRFRSNPVRRRTALVNAIMANGHVCALGFAACWLLNGSIIEFNRFDNRLIRTSAQRSRSNKGRNRLARGAECAACVSVRHWGLGSQRVVIGSSGLGCHN